MNNAKMTLKEFAALGGKARAAKLTAKRRREIAASGAKARAVKAAKRRKKVA